MRKGGASFHRGTSKQNYRTDPLFMKAVEKRFGKMDFDLAANVTNSQCGYRYYGPGSEWNEDSLSVDWSSTLPDKNLWLNPPYDDIPMWAKKCVEYRSPSPHGRIFFLVPASVGSNWFCEFVYPFARTFILNGRLTFVGQKDPYPKDCMLAMYGAGFGGKIEVWRWKSAQS